MQITATTAMIVPHGVPFLDMTELLRVALLTFFGVPFFFVVPFAMAPASRQVIWPAASVETVRLVTV